MSTWTVPAEELARLAGHPKEPWLHIQTRLGSPNLSDDPVWPLDFVNYTEEQVLALADEWHEARVQETEWRRANRLGPDARSSKNDQQTARDEFRLLWKSARDVLGSDPTLRDKGAREVGNVEDRFYRWSTTDLEPVRLLLLGETALPSGGMFCDYGLGSFITWHLKPWLYEFYYEKRSPLSHCPSCDRFFDEPPRRGRPAKYCPDCRKCSAGTRERKVRHQDGEYYVIVSLPARGDIKLILDKRDARDLEIVRVSFPACEVFGPGGSSICVLRREPL
jgi:hypothetical protein